MKRARHKPPKSAIKAPFKPPVSSPNCPDCEARHHRQGNLLGLCLSCANAEMANMKEKGYAEKNKVPRGFWAKYEEHYPGLAPDDKSNQEDRRRLMPPPKTKKRKKTRTARPGTIRHSPTTPH